MLVPHYRNIFFNDCITLKIDFFLLYFYFKTPNFCSKYLQQCDVKQENLQILQNNAFECTNLTALPLMHTIHIDFIGGQYCTAINFLGIQTKVCLILTFKASVD